MGIRAAAPPAGGGQRRGVEVGLRATNLDLGDDLAALGPDPGRDVVVVEDDQLDVKLVAREFGDVSVPQPVNSFEVHFQESTQQARQLRTSSGRRFADSPIAILVVLERPCGRHENEPVQAGAAAARASRCGTAHVTPRMLRTRQLARGFGPCS